MAAPKRTSFEHERDLPIVADMYLKGRSQYQIKEQLNKEFYSDRPLTRQMIGYDIKVLIRRWQKDALTSIDDIKARELEKINLMETEAWAAWERSCQDAETTVTERFEDTVAEFARTKAQIRKEGQAGDPRFLTVVQWCIEKRLALFGLNAPIKIAPTDPSGQKEYSGLTDTERVARLTELLTIAATIRDGQAPGVDDSGCL